VKIGLNGVNMLVAMPSAFIIVIINNNQHDLPLWAIS
jgi:hypothetical protein